MERKMLISVYSHFFKVTNVPLKHHAMLRKLVTKNCMFEMVKGDEGKNVSVPSKYFGFVNRENEYRFHIGQLPFLKQLFDYFAVGKDQYDTEVYDKFVGDTVGITFNPNFKLREFQPDAEAFILSSEDGDNNTRHVAVYTGGGKSVIASSALSKINKRVLIFVLPKYVDKWISDVQAYTDTKPKEIAVIEGGDSLAGVIEMGLNDKLKGIKFVIVSLVTARLMYKDYYSNYDHYKDKYVIEPEELCKVLGIGAVMIDEAHEHIYSVYQVLCHTHVDKVITLSATMTSGDRQVLEVQEFMFPKSRRYSGAGMKKYTNVYSVSYRFRNFNKGVIRFRAYNSNMYSHVEFEKSVLRYSQLKEAYLEMVEYLLHSFYLDKDYVKGDRCRIFAATVDMCEAIVKHMKRRYGNRFDIRRYAPSSGDPYENVIESEICATTAMSGGTGVDIKQLTCCITTNTILAPVQNEQMYGRLRELTDRITKFVYIYCEQIPKQVEGDKIKKGLYKHKARSIVDLNYPRELEFDPRIRR